MINKIKKIIFIIELIIGGALFILGIKVCKYNKTVKRSMETIKEDENFNYVLNSELTDEELSNIDNYYQEYVNLVASAFKEQDITNFYQVFQIYSVMNQKGYFSLGNRHFYGTPNFEVDGYLGASNVDTYTVCRNDAAFLKDLYESLGYESFILMGEAYMDEKSDVINHAVCGIKYEGNTYLLDYTNNAVYIKNKGRYTNLSEMFKFEPNMMSDFFDQNRDNTNFYLTINNRKECLEELYDNYLTIHDIYEYDNYFYNYEIEKLFETEYKLGTELYNIENEKKY